MTGQDLVTNAVNKPHISGFYATKILEVKQSMSMALNEFKKEKEKEVQEATNTINTLSEIMSQIENDGLSSNNLNNLENSFNESKKILDEETKKQIQELVEIGKKELAERESQEKQNQEIAMNDDLADSF